MALFTSPIPAYASGGSTRSSLHEHAKSRLSLTLLSLALERTDAQRGSMRSWIVAPCEPRKQPIEYEREANPMRKVIVSEFVTLDGVMEDPGGAEGFKHGGWSFGFGGADQQQYKFEELFASDALLLGRRTYEGFAAAWPNMPGTGAYGERMNSLPKHVVSTTLTALEWNNSGLIKANVAEEVAK